MDVKFFDIKKVSLFVSNPATTQQSVDRQNPQETSAFGASAVNRTDCLQLLTNPSSPIWFHIAPLLQDPSTQALPWQSALSVVETEGHTIEALVM